MRPRTLPTAIAVGLIVSLGPTAFPAAGGDEGGRRLSASLGGANEAPGPGDPDGIGWARLRMRPWKEQICFEIEVSGITLPATGAHIHQGAAGVAGPIVVNLAPPSTTGRSEGCVSAARALIRQIMALPGGYYVNVHTSDFTGGAVRGQLQRGFVPSIKVRTFTASLRGANEVPGPGDADGTGTATITITPSLNQVCWSISVSGIALPATAAHIHKGRAGVSGDVVVTLSAPDATGKANGCASGLSAALIEAILDGPAGYYVNVHTSDFPNGAVRGQLTRPGDGDDDDDDDEDDDDED